jgi:hypothetical protein
VLEVQNLHPQNNRKKKKKKQDCDTSRRVSDVILVLIKE